MPFQRFLRGLRTLSLIDEETIVSPELLGSGESLHGLPLAEILSQATQRRAELQDALNVLEPLIREARTAMTHCQDVIRCVSGALRFSRELPHDMLSRILEFAVNDCRDAVPLAAVSKTWRKTALLTPSLWTRILLKHVHPERSPVPFINMVLIRSRNHPLDLVVKLNTQSAQLDSASCALTILEALTARPHVERWRSADLKLHPRFLASSVFPLPATPHLEFIRIAGTRPSHRYPPTALLSKAPKLLQIDIRLHLSHNISWKAFSFGAIHTLRLKRAESLTSPLEILLAIPTLHTLHIQSWHSPANLLPSHRRVVHPNLRHLEWCGDIDWFLPNLTAPALETLRSRSNFSSVQDLSRFLSRSPALQEVTVHLNAGNYLPGSSMSFRVEPSASSVRKLQLNISWFADQHELLRFSQMFSGEHIATGFPHLEDLILAVDFEGSHNSAESPTQCQLAFHALTICEAKAKRSPGVLPNLRKITVILPPREEEGNGRTQYLDMLGELEIASGGIIEIVIQRIERAPF